MMNPQGHLNFQKVLLDWPGCVPIFPERFPVTAATGETPAARLAGEMEDNSTVKTPTQFR